MASATRVAVTTSPWAGATTTSVAEHTREWAVSTEAVTGSPVIGGGVGDWGGQGWIRARGGWTSMVVDVVGGAVVDVVVELVVGSVVGGGPEAGAASSTAPRQAPSKSVDTMPTSRRRRTITT